MKPIITVYSTGATDQTKKFEGYISAAFWIGVDHAEGDLSSVKVRQPTESYDFEVEKLQEFATLMIQRQINFTVEYFTEPSQEESQPQEIPVQPSAVGAGGPGKGASDDDYTAVLEELKDDFTKGTLTKKQYESKRNVLLKQWKEKIEGMMGT